MGNILELLQIVAGVAEECFQVKLEGMIEQKQYGGIGVRDVRLRGAKLLG
jgi:hypothetical protein